MSIDIRGLTFLMSQRHSIIYGFLAFSEHLLTVGMQWPVFYGLMKITRIYNYLQTRMFVQMIYEPPVRFFHLDPTPNKRQTSFPPPCLLYNPT